MHPSKVLEVPIRGMDCAECTVHVQKAIAALPGVAGVEVFLASEKAVITLDPIQVDLPEIRLAVERAGYSVASTGATPGGPAALASRFTRLVLIILGMVFGAVLFVIVVGEWLGLFAALTNRVPWLVGVALVLAGGFPVFRNVIRSALRGQVISHTLMTLGVLAALVVGEWATAAVVVFFMRVGDGVEHLTAERARKAVKDLAALAPQKARLEASGVEVEVPVEKVQAGDIVVVRPGEAIPVDGEVVSGQATIDQASITGESMPVEAGPGSRVFAATHVRLGSLRVRASQVGKDSTFGRIIKMVEEAEAHRAPVQRIADKFSAYFLPFVLAIAALTFWLSREPLAAAAVLVVACSCSFALATPIAVLAAIGASARRGLMFKGGKYLELLAQADVLLIDKTGTLTLGKPQIVDIVEGEEYQQEFPGHSLLYFAASAERYSEHPLAEAARSAALQRGLDIDAPEGFVAIPGIGIRANVQGLPVEVGSLRMFSARPIPVVMQKRAEELEAQGKTLLFVAVEGRLAGFLAASDTLRTEVPQAVAALCELGVRQVELLTGDNERVAATLVEQLRGSLCDRLEMAYRANLLPEDKIRAVQEYQLRGRKVIMVGDGVNDAPALAQADVGIAMGAAGSGVALEAAHVALMREDWRLVPEALRIARRAARVVRMNLAFTLIYNGLGLTLAALGILPPIFAAAAQSLPDLLILGNSSRLLRG